MSRGERWALAAVVAGGAALRFMPVPYGLPFVFHPDETYLVVELGKFLGGLTQGSIPFGVSTFHYPLALVYAAYFGVGLATGRFTSVADVQAAFLLDDPALHAIGRGMTATFSVATIFLTFLVGRKVYGSRAGLIAALLTTFSLVDISGAHWLKHNSTVTMMAMASMLAILHAGRTGLRPWAVGIVLGAAVATRIDLAVVLPLFLLSVAVEADGRFRLSGLGALVDRRVVVTLGVAVLAYLLVSFNLASLVASQVVDQSAFRTRPVAASILQFLAAGDLAVTLRHNAWFYLTRGLIGTSGIVVALFVMAGLVKAVRSHRREELVLLGFVGLLLIQLLVFNVYGIHYFGRFVPALMIFAAGAILAVVTWLPIPARAWGLAVLLGAAAAQPVYYSVRYVHYVATNVDTRVRARQWIYAHVPFGSAIALQKFDELPRYLPPLTETRDFAAEKLEQIRADGRGSGLAMEARLVAYPADTYRITNLSVEDRWDDSNLPLENNYDFDRLKASGIRYVVTAAPNSPVYEEPSGGLLISASAIDSNAMTRYEEFMTRLRTGGRLLSEFAPRDAEIVSQTDSPIDPTIRVYEIP